jgi:large subunit ribosomal protein L21
MYAVIRTGGKQYRVAAGDRLRVEKVPGNVGDPVVFEEVLLVAGESLALGKPLVAGAKVEAKIVEQGLGPKLVIFKFRRRKNYRRKTGHRQPFTALEITNIVPAGIVPGGSVARAPLSERERRSAGPAA